MVDSNPATNASTEISILKALRQHSLISDDPGWCVALVPGGSTGRTFSVLDPAGEPRYTARLARVGLEGWLRREEQVLREMAVDGSTISPLTLSRLPASESLPAEPLVHEHIPGAPLRIADVSAAALERLGAALAWLHGHRRDGFMIWPSLDVRHGTRAENFHERIASLRRYSSLATLPHADAELERLTEAAADLPLENGWGESSFALIHGDLSPGNILWRGDDITLIDWEFARDGDPAEDLAYLITQGHVDPEQFAEIAEAYVDAGGDPWALARVNVWLPLVELDARLWWADWELANRAPSVEELRQPK